MKLIGFRVRIDSPGREGTEDGTWESISGGGTALPDCAPPRARLRPLPSVGEVVLSGPFNPERKQMLEWYKDMVQNGDAARDVTVTYLGVDADGRGGKVERVRYLDCFLTQYTLGPVAANGGAPLTEALHFEVSRIELA